MNRRTFLKITASVVAWTPFSWLSARAEAWNSKPYAKRVPLTPFDAPPGSWTFALLPDTQYYSQKYPEVVQRQAKWLVAHRKSHQIRFVAHEGDLVNNPTDTKQWEHIQKALHVLRDGGMPFSILPGNHDLGTQAGGDTNGRATLLNDYFDAGDYHNSRAMGLFEPGHLENSWHEFSAPSDKYLLMALEFGPRDEVLAWANGVVTDHPKHKIILVTHAYLFHDSQRDTWALDEARGGRANPKKYPLFKQGDMNDGQDIWDKLVSRHPNFLFTFNGHVTGSGVGHLESKGAGGRPVHQILANYQDNSPKAAGTVVPARGYGGGGFLRLVQFHPDGQTVQIRTYSPWYDEWLSEPEQQFAVTFA
ncbi:metallophosphoesterase [soil metagenome]